MPALRVAFAGTFAATLEPRVRDRIDRPALPAETALANVYGHETGIAEYVIGAMLALTRDFGRLDGALRRGTWESQWAVNTAAPTPWPELAGKTLGILGYGRIGQCVARRARAFDMTVLAVRRNVAQADPHAELLGPEALDDVLARADYLAITLPLTPETRGLLGERELARMKPTAMLVNVARAEIVDEAALYRALARRTIAAAVVDVWYRYPTAPHVSGWTQGMLEARAALIADNIHRTARGEPPVNLIR
jgi:phosphoglycerate dehydrogenase-like enzyme